MKEFERGDGTPLHLHPYPEVFLVERNTALFTAGDEELTITAGNFVVVPADTPHRYVGASDEAVRLATWTATEPGPKLRWHALAHPLLSAVAVPRFSAGTTTSARALRCA